MGKSRYQAEIRELIGHRLLVTPGVAAVVRDDAGRILLQLRSDDGRWGLPSGGIDPGETPWEAVIREVGEETGLHVLPRRIAGVFGGPRHGHTYPNGDQIEPVTVVWDCEVVGGELHRQPGETAGLRWFPPEEAAAELPAYPAELVVAPGAGPALFDTADDDG